MLTLLRIKRRLEASYAQFAACVVLTCALALPGFSTVSQDSDQKKPAPSAAKQKDEGKVPSEKESEKNKKKLESKAEAAKLTPAEVVAETTIFAYGGRKALESARANIQEEGTIKLATDQGDITGGYNLRSIRKEKSWQDLLRVDLELTPPESALRDGTAQTIKYVAAFNGASVWSAQNGQYVSPRPEVEAAFRAQLTHDYTTLLRYKEDGSKLEYVGPETVVGLETSVIDLTTPDGEKTRYWVSAKTYRVLHLEYEIKLGGDQPPTKYRISYYYTPQRVVQNTLVPARRVMAQDGKLVQEINITDINYSAKLEPEIFQHLQAQ